jgi:hypothetical protein
MNHLRSILRDLIDRRLWPVALLLAVALAAVPVVLGREGDAAPLPVPATPSATAESAATAKAEVTLDTSVPQRRDRGGKVRNPFKGVASAATKTTATALPAGDAATPTSGTSSASAPDSGPSAGSGSSSPATTGSPSADATSGSTPTTTPTTKPTTKPKTTTPAKPKAEDPSDTFHVSIRFGLNGGKLTTQRDVARLSALPSVTDPFFVYLGVLETATTHEKRAVFLVSSDATPNGEGACHPTKDDCESVELAVGQTAYFDYTAPSGAVTQYQLELAGIHKTEVHTEAKASAAFARHSVAGGELLADAATRNVRAAAGARAYRYLPGAGLLARAKRKHVTAKAAAAGTLVPGLALLPRKRQPGIAVWHSPAKR